MSGRTIPFPWYGGKFKHVPWLLDLLPQKSQYVEPFGGSAAVLINREPSDVETYNDIDGEVVNFFRVLREKYDEFEHRLKYTPHSRQMYQRACEEEPEDNVQRALFFLVRTAQAYNGIQGGGWASSIGESRRGMGQRTAAWEYRIECVEETAERFKRVQIESRDAVDVVERHDRENTLFYCDPPYPPQARESTGQYNFEMDEGDHRELAKILNGCDGHVALSSYSCPLMEELYEGWYVSTDEEKALAGKNRGTRQEVCYTNYDPNEVGR